MPCEWAPGLVSAKPIACDATAGSALDAVAASWTMQAPRETCPPSTRMRRRGARLINRKLAGGAGARRPGPPKAGGRRWCRPPARGARRLDLYMAQFGSAQDGGSVLRRLTGDILPPSDLRQWSCFGHSGATFPRDVGSGRPGLALVVLSVVEQRLDAVRAVLDGAEVVEVAARVRVHRATVHRWLARYLAGQLAGLADRSHRPRSSPRQAAEMVEVAVTDRRRGHDRQPPRCPAGPPPTTGTAGRPAVIVLRPGHVRAPGVIGRLAR
jgi:leucine-zipper of insertion element IS481